MNVYVYNYCYSNCVLGRIRRLVRFLYLADYIFELKTNVNFEILEVDDLLGISNGTPLRPIYSGRGFNGKIRPTPYFTLVLFGFNTLSLSQLSVCLVTFISKTVSSLCVVGRACMFQQTRKKVKNQKGR